MKYKSNPNKSNIERRKERYWWRINYERITQENSPGQRLSISTPEGLSECKTPMGKYHYHKNFEHYREDPQKFPGVGGGTVTQGGEEIIGMASDFLRAILDTTTPANKAYRNLSENYF